MIKKTLLSIGLLLGISGCVSNPATSQQTASIKTIGVISAVGDIMSYPKLGITIFNAYKSEGDISSWGIDQLIVEEITKKLSPAYVIVPLHVDKTALKEPLAAQHIFNRGTPPAESLRAAVKQGTPDVDAYLVVSPLELTDIIGETEFSYSGLGIYRRPGYGIQVYIVANASLIDAHDFKVLGEAPLAIARSDLTFAQVFNPRNLAKVQRPHRKVDAKLARASSWAEFTPEQLEQIKVEIESLLTDSLDYPLKGIGLTQGR